MTPSTDNKKIAIISCSTRVPRVNPYISTYIQSVVAPLAPSNVSFTILDIADQGLPLYDEPAVPSTFPPSDPTPHYAHAHTRAWSSVISSYDGFIFVTPQYNWSVPASLKNALDYLFYEWKGKPAAIVTYGGHGGNKAAEHLRGILGGLRMQAAATNVLLPIPVRTFMQTLQEHGKVPEDQIKVWREAGVEDRIQESLEQLVQLLQQPPAEK
ncbi:hypothetical protein EMPS_06911 [Entomortierella parvispora]|uniref:NADPH-dependent FMN reductase-like domain-containing protein n=1 Tax=Entomortierella parvispora TaxID=205924 RepID=A0A9P3HDW8_9FUNG|nr:hypothetical protein EMPS_06911 [Entomortierella parvispora]